MKENRAAERTRMALGDALLELLESRKLSEITVSELTAACGLNRQTFYYHFRDVRALLEWVLRRKAERLTLLQEKGASLEESLRQRLVCLTAYRASLCRLAAGSSGALILSFLKAGAEELVAGYFGQSAMSGLRARFCADVVAGGALSWIEGGMVEPVEELARVMCAALASVRREGGL